MAEVTYADVTRACADRDPQFVDLVITYSMQTDPQENGPEDADEGERVQLPEGTWTLAKLRASMAQSESRTARNEAWEGIERAPFHPPRLELGDLLLGLYEGEEAWARASLIRIFKEAQLGWGIWKAFKRIYKLSEERHDAVMFGAIAYRLDAFYTRPHTGEIKPATIKYLRRRPWRYLRQLGRAVPELYPEFAARVLEHYPKRFQFGGTWTANQIWAHHDLIGEPGPSCWISGPPDRLDRRAYHEAWKISPEPLLRLLEEAENDAVCDFAIRSLKADFRERLRRVEASWLARIGKRPLASVHQFIVTVLEDSPEFHQSKLRSIGLAEMVLGFLHSENERARAYAIEYARGHAPEIAVSELVDLAEEGADDVRAFVLSRLAKLSPAQIGLGPLIRLIAVQDATAMAEEKIKIGFSPSDLTEEHFIVLAVGQWPQRKFLKAFYPQAPARFHAALLDDPRCDWTARREALEELEKRGGREIGAEWLKKALMDPQLVSTVSSWLRAGKLAGADLDVEWVKGLVMRPTLRGLAIDLLQNRSLVAPSSIGLGWLLAMARQPDQALHEFAHRYLLEHFSPEDFGGTDRLWALASDAKEPEQVRAFAATYLKVHHPELGPTSAESRTLGIKPKLSADAYRLAKVRPLFFDERADVRRLAAAIGKMELVRWGDRTLLYDLCDSRFREGRAFAAEVLFAIGEADADERFVPPRDWIDAVRVFALAESSIKASREIASTLIRRHYETIGGARRLAWLMESPDREVRLFAVRLLWDRHRHHSAFDSLDALRLFLRTVMFGLPPGRMERRELSDDAVPDRALPASVAKRRLLEVIRDFAVEDEAFARVVLPVLEEFTRSKAKGEWHGCIAALAWIRRAHPSLPTPLPEAVK